MTATDTYLIDDHAIQREAGLWVVEQTLDGDGRIGLAVYNSANTGSDETEAIALRDALRLAWALVRQVVSVAARRVGRVMARAGRSQEREGGAS